MDGSNDWNHSNCDFVSGMRQSQACGYAYANRYDGRLEEQECRDGEGRGARGVRQQTRTNTCEGPSRQRNETKDGEVDYAGS